MTALDEWKMARSNLHVEAVLRSSIQHVHKKLMLKDNKIKKLKKKIDEKNSVMTVEETKHSFPLLHGHENSSANGRAYTHV